MMTRFWSNRPFRRSPAWLAWAWLLWLLPTSEVVAHNGDDHAAPTTVAAGSPGYFTVSAASEKFELVLRYPPLEARKAARLRLFLADFATNAPVAHARLGLTVLEDSAAHLIAHETAPGDYELTGEFPQNKPYSVAVQVVGPDGRADLLLLRPVAVGQALPSVNPAGTAEPTRQSWQIGLLAVAAFAFGVGLTAFFFHRKNRSR